MAQGRLELRLTEESTRIGKRRVRRLERKLCAELLQMPQFSTAEYQSHGDLDADFTRSYTYPSFSGTPYYFLSESCNFYNC